MKLAAKVVAVFLLAVMVLTTIQAVLAVRRERELFRLEQENQARRLTSEIEAALLAALQSQQHEKVTDLLMQKQAATHTIQLQWIRFDATASVGDNATSEFLLKNIQRGELVSFETHEGGVGILHTYYVLTSVPRDQGVLHFSKPLAPLEQHNRDTIFRTLCLLGGMSLLSVLVIVLAGICIIGRPLQKLIDKTQRIGTGDLTTPVELHSRDEFGQLATALNDMCDKLVQQQQRIGQESATRLATMEQLRHADRLKTVGRLAAGIAHELGTPLNVVSGRAGLIASGKLNDDEVRTSADIIKTEANRIAGVIRQLLDFARRKLPERSNADLREVVVRTVNLLESLAAKQNIRLIVTGDQQPLFAKVDAGQMQQVVTNLLVNAIQAMPDGGQVTVQLARETATPPDVPAISPIAVYSLTVADQGHGIDDADVPHIFEPFFTTKDVGSGTGLGLSIVHGIVREHGGWIEVQSEKNVGSRFTIRIPIESTTQPTAEGSP